MSRYLTKSRFKLAIECPTKLFYTNNSNYTDINAGDDFLAALAEGGFQVGELAKFYFSKDPVKDKITITEKDETKALAETTRRLTKPSVVIAEASFSYKNLFIRADIIVKKSKNIELYEVKAKSWSSDDDFWKKDKSGKKTGLKSEWLPYLYDVAFQKYVVQKATRKTVAAFLVLADKDQPATVDGLNQKFRIQRNDKRSHVVIAPGTTQSSLGKIPLAFLNVDDECEWIYKKSKISPELPKEYSFEEIITLFADAYENNKRLDSALGLKCRDCQFNASKDNKRNGFHECWTNIAKFKKGDFDKPLVLELWSGKSGGKSLINDAIAAKKYFLNQLTPDDYNPPKNKPSKAGMQPGERRGLQIRSAINRSKAAILDKSGLEKVFKSLEPPYHFIDFETSMVAMPFHKDRKPYEAIAFQYSYHRMDEKGDIAHIDQYLDLKPEFPNYDFVRDLRKNFNGVKGTIFRYHNHENNYLLSILKQLEEEKKSSAPEDRKELIGFIKHITHNNDKKKGWKGPKDMQDLWELVLSYYYSPVAKGSNSIKDILPAVIHDSDFIRKKYSKPIYGTKKIESLNFKQHVWINKASGNNPYKTLPPVFGEYDNNELDNLTPLIGEIKDGGAAMMAYAYSQFADIQVRQKEMMKQAMYRYCELDTMAMVMIWEYWGKSIGMW